MYKLPSLCSPLLLLKVEGGVILTNACDTGVQHNQSVFCSCKAHCVSKWIFLGRFPPSNDKTIQATWPVGSAISTQCFHGPQPWGSEWRKRQESSTEVFLFLSLEVTPVIPIHIQSHGTKYSFACTHDKRELNTESNSNVYIITVWL